MNIFFYDRDPKVIAQSSVTAHVNKMIFECAQLLTSAHEYFDNEYELGYPTPKSVRKHPCAVWTRESKAHYAFVYDLMLAYADEYERRYGKKHYVYRNGLCDNLMVAPKPISKATWIDPPQCMPDLYKVDGDTVQAYRNYYNIGKRHLHKWTKGAIKPDWITSSD